MTGCATAEQLRQLLAEALPEPSVPALRAHLAACPRCQALLDRLSDDPELEQWLAAAGPPQPPPTATPTSLLERLLDTSLSSEPAPGPVPVPAELGPYRVLAEVGRGGMGVVYKAHDPDLDRVVAVKVLRPERADEAARTAFAREARAAAGVRHDHVVPVYAVVAPPGAPPFLVMQYVEGPTLRERIRAAGRLDPREAATVGRQVAEGLAAAHRAGVVHRDVKPSNVILDAADGRAKLTDFSLARVPEQTGVTREGVIAGTPEYMSPEHVRTPGWIDARSDVYGLGVTLYEALTGAVPFRGTAPEVLRQIQEDEPTPPSRLNPAVPGDLEVIVLKALAKAPDDRYATAQDLADDLQRFLDDRPILARRPTLGQRARRWSRRHRAAVWSAATAGTAVLALLIAWLVASNAVISGERDQARAAERERTRQLYRALFTQAQASRYGGRVGARADALSALEQAAGLLPALDPEPGRELELRNELLACLALPDVRTERQWDGYPAESRADCFDADLRRYARGDEAGTVTVCRVEDGSELVRLTGVGNLLDVSRLRFSPDGRFLAVRHEARPHMRLTVWDLETRQKRFAVEGVRSLDFSPDGRWLAVSHNDGSVRLLEVPGGREHKRLARGRPATGELHVRFDPAGNRLAVWDFAPEVELWDVECAVLLRKLTYPEIVLSTAWHPDGRTLAVGCVTLIHLTPLAGGSPAAVLPGHQSGTIALAFNPAGDLLASHGDATVRLWDHQSRREVVSLTGALVGPYWSRDGRGLAVRHGPRPAVLRAERPAEYRVYHHARGSDHDPLGFCRGDRLLVSPGVDGVRLRDLLTGAEVGHLPVGRMRGALVLPDGRRLLTCGDFGLDLWPLEVGPDRARLGPPAEVRHELGAGLTYPALAANGRTLVVHDGNHQGAVLDLSTGQVRGRSGEHFSHWVSAVSPDGRWVASGTWHGHECRVWAADTGEVVARIAHKHGTHSRPAFSPDGTRLAVGVEGRIRVFEVGPWAPLWEAAPADLAGVVPAVAFSPDGALAVSASRELVRLLDPATGRELATLTAPGAGSFAGLSVSPDGGWLAATSGSAAAHLWDLRAIGRRLSGLGIGGDWPAQRPADPTPGAGPVRLEADLGDLSPARRQLAIGRWQVGASATRAEGFSALAWVSATGEGAVRDPAGAVTLARRAVNLAPTHAHHTTLGVAYYRLGRWVDAVEALQKGIDADRGRATATDLFFLAMCFHHQGQEEKARDAYRRAVVWAAQHRPEDDELRRFRAEAAGLLRP